MVAAVPEMLLTQSIILLHSNAVDVANALHNSCSSNSAWVWMQNYQWLLSGLKGQEFTLEMELHLVNYGSSSQIFHHSTQFAASSRHVWLVSRVLCGKAKKSNSSGCDGLILSFAVLLGLTVTLWRKGCRWYGMCTSTVKEETLSITAFSTFRLEMKVIKSSGGMPRLSYTGRDDRHFVPTGLYIVRTMSGRKRESPLSFSLSLQVKSIDQACLSCNLVKN